VTPAAPPSPRGERDAARARRALPVLAPWLRDYRARWLGFDLVAGLTLAAYAVPASLAYSTLAGLPAESGLYAYLVGGIAYAAFATSRHVAFGPTSSISILLGGSLAGLAAGSSPADAGALLAVLVAGVALIGWVLRFGQIASFISDTILAGFKAGAALVIASTQLPKLLGISSDAPGFFGRTRDLMWRIDETHLPSLAVGLAGLALLAVGQRFLPARPVALVVVVLSLIVSSVAGLPQQGVAVVGDLAPGLPAIELPALVAAQVPGLLPLVLGCFLLAYVEAVSAARTFAEKHRYEIDQGRELLALGMANLATGLAQGYPAAGGMSQSAVNERAGARSPLALVFASGAIAVVLLFLTHLMSDLPQPILAAVVLMAVKDLIDVGELRHLARVNKIEFRVAMVAFVAVLVLGILFGLLLAVIFSIWMLLRWAANPHAAVLGRIPGTDRFGDAERHPKNERTPGVTIFRVEGGLYYFNVATVKSRLLELLEDAPEPVELVIFDLSTSPQIDVAGVRMLGELHDRLAEKGIALELAEVHASSRELLRAEGMEGRFGKIDRASTVLGLLEARTPAAAG
jgi:high affinity sulfate transporter 1